MPTLEDTYGVFACNFCGRQETSTPRILAGAGWHVVPYKTYNLCPHCELQGWIAKQSQKNVCDVVVPADQQESETIEKSVGPPVGGDSFEDRKKLMKDYDWHRPHRGGRNEKK